MRLILMFCFIWISSPLFSMENFIKPQDIDRLKTPQEILPKDIWEDCGNCCCRENDSNCPCGLIFSSIAGCSSFVLATNLKSYFSCSNLVGDTYLSCIKTSGVVGIKVGVYAAIASTTVSGLFACYLGDYATAQDEKREKMYAEYLKSMEKLSPRSREAHIKECMKERVKHVQNKID